MTESNKRVGKGWIGIFHVLLFLVACSCVLPVSRLFPDEMTEPKWFSAVFWGLLLFIYCSTLTLLGKNFDRIMFYESICKSLLWCVIGEFLIFLLQTMLFLPAYGKFTVGTFDNAAGFSSFLCLSLPFELHTKNHQEGLPLLLSYCAIIASILAIFYIQSRTGMMCIAFLILIEARKYEEKKPFIVVFVFHTFFFLFSILHKKEF